jgi:hypothetical protein
MTYKQVKGMGSFIKFLMIMGSVKSFMKSNVNREMYDSSSLRVYKALCLYIENTDQKITNFSCTKLLHSRERNLLKT